MMARNARCGYGESRSFGLFSWPAFCLGPLRWIMALAVAAALTGYAQDVSVHIQPRPTPDPTAAKDKSKPPDIKPQDAKAPDVTTDPGLKMNHGKPIQVDVDLVLVNVTVTDDWNRIVTGLDKENFSILEGNELQQVKAFSSEDAPLSVGIIFDMSGSMSDKIEKAREAVIEFMKTANPQDEFFMVTFNDRPELRAEFTRSVEEIQGKLAFTAPKGRTALLDAIYMGLHKMKDARNTKKALLIISDGGDNSSRYTEREIKARVKEADVQIYSIGIFTSGTTQPEEVLGPGLLTEISDVTGGRMFTLNSANELADVAGKIGIELRNQYVLGYRPSNKAKDGHWRKIKVKLIPPKGWTHLNVYSKTGYYAPSQ